MSWDTATQTSVRLVGSTRYTDDAEFVDAIRTALERKRVVEPRANAIIDAFPDVPWKDVINVLDLCKANRIDHVELAGPMPAK
jgi:biopolymer transport protein ExbD